MILLLGGTREANEFASKLGAKRIPFIITVVSAYGAEIASKSSQEVIAGCLNEKALQDLVINKKITTIIDMTHPYAEQISILAHDLAEKQGIVYYRYQRPAVVSEMDTVVTVSSYGEAAIKSVALAKERRGNVFLTIGSKWADAFHKEGKRQGVRVVCRVLPDPDVLTQLRNSGICSKDIVALLGPFSREFNKAMFAEYQAAVVVTKDAGVVGGTDTKVSASSELGIPIVVVKRPGITGETIFTEIDDLLRRVSE